MSNQDMDIGRRSLFAAAGGLGMLAAIGPAGRAEAADPTEADQANLKLVKDFCAVWPSHDLEKIGAFLADDCVYRMTETTPPAVGRDAVIRQIKTYFDKFKLEFEVVEAVARGPVVMTVRFDHFNSPERNMTWHGVGMFFVKKGKIAEWSDYTISMS